jgi:membrane protease YdiL (CAAX protease family)
VAGTPAHLIRDPLFWAALAAGPAVCAGLALLPWVPWSPGLPTGPLLWAVWAGLVYPPLEEYVFRGGLQPWLAGRWAQSWGPLTVANLGTSAAFTGLHFFFHPPLWAAGVFAPSLVFGYFRERHDGLAAPILLRASYNAAY